MRGLRDLLAVGPGERGKHFEAFRLQPHLGGHDDPLVVIDDQHALIH
jgi:hypothetical protein